MNYCVFIWICSHCLPTITLGVYFCSTICTYFPIWWNDYRYN